MNTKKHLGATALLISAALLGACTTDSDPDPDPEPTSGCLVEGTNTLNLNITADVCELDADGTYDLQGVTYVKFGSLLKIGAGATIRGKSDGSLSALVVERGAHIHAVGTADNPIVFTAGTSAPERGDFGGVVLLGDADINLPTETGDIEGLVGVPYGGSDDADSSGVMKYVRIEYAGNVLGSDNELNGLTMGGVGSKTQISYIQVYDGLDDCFEWFGGTVSATHLAATICDDDMFDWDHGWRGNLQFAVGVHDATASSSDPNGIEADNLGDLEDNLPRSNPKVANLTLIGNGDNSLNGMRLRRGTAGHIVNSIVTGFATGRAVRVDGNSVRLLANDSLVLEGIYAYANGGRTQLAPAAGLPDSATAIVTAQTNLDAAFLADTASLGLSLTVWKPTSAPAGAVTVPAGLQAASYVGAFDPAAATLWTEGWIK